MGRLEGSCVKYWMKYEQLKEIYFFSSAHTRAINNVICEHKKNHDLYVIIVHDVELNTMYMRITTTWYKINVDDNKICHKYKVILNIVANMSSLQQLGLKSL